MSFCQVRFRQVRFRQMRGSKNGLCMAGTRAEQRRARRRCEAESGCVTQRLRTFEEVEALWDEAIRPRLKAFKTMQDLFPGQEPLPEGSVWHANWRVPDRG